MTIASSAALSATPDWSEAGFFVAKHSPLKQTRIHASVGVDRRERESGRSDDDAEDDDERDTLTADECRRPGWAGIGKSVLEMAVFRECLTL